MNETYVTLQGWLGGQPTLRRAGDSAVAGFRVASTPRRYQRSSSTWVEGEVQWFSVTAWRTLAEHCARSLRRGDPVVVHGRLTQRTWTDAAGVERSTSEVEAVFVGHDLNRGTSAFTRTPRASQPAPLATTDEHRAESGSTHGPAEGQEAEQRVEPAA